MRLTRQQCDRLQRDHMILSHAQFPSIPMKAGKAVRTMTKRTTSTASSGQTLTDVRFRSTLSIKALFLAKGATFMLGQLRTFAPREVRIAVLEALRRGHGGYVEPR